jgi:hypothetical protein
MTVESKTRVDYLRDAIAVRAKRKERCPVALTHMPMTTCPTCTMFMPRGGYSFELIDGQPVSELNVYREGWIVDVPEGPGATTPEHRAEIFAATQKYQDAIADVTRANDALIAAARRRRRQPSVSGELIADSQVEFITRSNREDAALSDAITAAEDAAAFALQELNIVSIPRGPQRESLRRAAEGLAGMVRRVAFG